MWCAICGLYAQKAPRGLVKPCKGVASRAGRANLTAFKNNRHPKHAMRLSDGHAYLPVGLLPVPASAGGAQEELEEGLSAGGEQRGAGERAAAIGGGRGAGGSTQEVELEQLRREEGGLGGAGGGGVGEGEGGHPAGGAGELELGGVGGVGEDAQEVRQERRRPNVYSIGGVMLGEEVAHQIGKSTSTKRSKFRF